MEVPNALVTPITPFPNSGERLIAQVIGRAREVNGTQLQYLPAPAVERHLLDRHALMLLRPYARICDQVLERTGRNHCVRGREFRDAKYEAAVRSSRSPR